MAFCKKHGDKHITNPITKTTERIEERLEEDEEEMCVWLTMRMGATSFVRCWRDRETYMHGRHHIAIDMEHVESK